jgi:hypothetical protein
MAGSYVTKAQGESMKLDYSKVGNCRQSFLHRFASESTNNEAITIRWFIGLDARISHLYNEILVFLAKYHFATYGQMKKLLDERGYNTEDFDERVQEMIQHHVLNCFYLCESPDLESEEVQFPEDAFVVYCMDHCAKQLLIHFYRDDFVYWRVTDCNRNIEQIFKYLSTCQFFLALAEVKKDNLKSFEAVYDASIGRRISRYSAIFEVSSGTTNNRRKFVLESVRSYDLPEYWNKKVSEQIANYVEHGYWRQSFVDYPYFVLLAEDKESALMAAEKLALRLPKLKVCITTDQEVRKGMANAEFYKFVRPEGDPAAPGSLKIVSSEVFSTY